MCQGSDRDKVHAALGIVAQGCERDAAGGFRLVASANHLDGLLGIGWREVVEHDAVHAADIQHLLEFVEVAHLDFYLQVLSFFLQILVATGNRRFDAASEIHVVIFQENHIEETDAVVHAAADADCLLLDHTQTRCRLASIEDARLRSFQRLDIFAGSRRDAAHTLHDVQHQTLSLQERLHFALDFEGDVAFLHLRAVVDKDRHLQLRVESVEDTFSHIDTGQDTVFLD